MSTDLLNFLDSKVGNSDWQSSLNPACPVDTDGDEVVDNMDNCPLVANPGQENSAGGTSGLVSYWDFNENDGVTANDSINGNTGILINGPTRTTGIVGSALSFDGNNDYVTVNDNTNLDFTDETTLSLRVYLDDYNDN